VDLHQLRHFADYDYAKKWSRIEVQTDINTASAAFQSWKIVSKEKLAQDYLATLLVKERKH
jgi:hypothetical protein